MNSYILLLQQSDLENMDENVHVLVMKREKHLP